MAAGISTAAAGVTGLLSVIGSTVTIVAPSLWRSTAMAITHARFLIPDVGVGDDEAWFRHRNRHSPLFRIEQLVEMIVALIHAGGGDLLDLLFCRTGGFEPTTHAFKLQERLVLPGRHEISGQSPIAGNRHGFTLRLQLPKLRANSAAETASDIILSSSPESITRLA